MAFLIEARTIPHSEHRYETVGDYFDRDGVKQFRVSDMGNEDYEFLVLIHELIEEHLTRKRGIAEPEIVAFDIAFEAQRQDGDTSEPGDSHAAPYRKEHQFATKIEREIADELGVDWSKYDEAVMAL